MTKVFATGLTVDRNNMELSISWDDKSESVIPFGLLRNACPCAECAGGHENMRSSPDPTLSSAPPDDPRKSELLDIQIVGNYALTITWGDNHSYGIYQWDYLKALEPLITGK